MTENFPTAILRNFQFCTDLKTEKWKDAKNAIERIENSRTRSWEGRGFEIWKLDLDVLDKVYSQEVYTWAFFYVCVYVCMYVRHAQKIAKLFFSVRSTQFPFKLIILFIKKYINLLGPKILRFFSLGVNRTWKNTVVVIFKMMMMISYLIYTVISICILLSIKR